MIPLGVSGEEIQIKPEETKLIATDENHNLLTWGVSIPQIPDLKLYVLIYQLNYGPQRVEINETLKIEISLENVGNISLQNVNLKLVLLNESDHIVENSSLNLHLTDFPSKKTISKSSKSFRILKPGVYRIFLYDLNYTKLGQLNQFITKPFPQNISVITKAPCMSRRSIDLTVDDKLRSLGIKFYGEGCFTAFKKRIDNKEYTVISPYDLRFPYPKESITPRHGRVDVIGAEKIKAFPFTSVEIQFENRTFHSQLLTPRYESEVGVMWGDDWEVKSVEGIFSPLIRLPEFLSDSVDPNGRILLTKIGSDSLYVKGDIFSAHSGWYPWDFYELNFNISFFDDTVLNQSFSYKGPKFLREYDVILFNSNRTYNSTITPHWENDDLILWKSYQLQQLIEKNMFLQNHYKLSSFDFWIIPVFIILIFVFVSVYYFSLIYQCIRRRSIKLRSAYEFFIGIIAAYLFQIYFYSQPIRSYDRYGGLTVIDALFLVNGLLLLFLYTTSKRLEGSIYKER